MNCEPYSAWGHVDGEVVEAFAADHAYVYAVVATRGRVGYLDGFCLSCGVFGDPVVAIGSYEFEVEVDACNWCHGYFDVFACGCCEVDEILILGVAHVECSV